MTGTYPITHGIRHFFPRAKDRQTSLPKLPQILSAHSYQTSVVSDYAGEMFNAVDFGFQRLKVPPSYQLSTLIEREVGYAHFLLFTLFDGIWVRKFLPASRMIPIDADPFRLANETEEELTHLASSEKPFFLLSFFSSIHLPYTVLFPYYQKFANSNYSGPNLYGNSVREFNQLHPYNENFNIQAERDQITDLYDNALLETDSALSQIFKKMEELNLLENTIVILLSDHGETILSDGKTLGHGSLFVEDESDIRMTFGIHLPPALARAKPQVVGDIVRSIDIAPTLLELLNIPVPKTMEGIPLLKTNMTSQGKIQIPALEALVETEISLNSIKEFKSTGALTYPPIKELIEPESEDGPYRVKEKYETLLRKAKWRLLVNSKGKLVYIPKKEGATWDFSGDFSSLEKTNMKNRLLKYLLEEPAVLLSSGQTLELKK